MRHYRWLLLACVLLSPSALVSTTHAQAEQAAITGTVTDQRGAVVPGAKVIVTNLKTRAIRDTQTNSEGNYSVPYLPPGEYEIVVEAQGFSKEHLVDVNLAVGSTATVNVALRPGGLQEAVSVTAGAVQLERQTGSLGNVVGSLQITELPLLGRNPYDLVTLAPGVVDRGNSGTGPIINGGRSNTSEVLLDGAEQRNSTTNDLNYTPPLETVQEFKVITNNMSAEFGRSGGGVLIAATRSGANVVHGSLFEFFRNDKLNANTWQNNRASLPRSPFRRNEYGGTVGGPVFIPRVYNGRDKTFFFLSLEQVKERAPNDIIMTVPTDLQRRGDFSQTLDASGNLIKIFDPATTRPDPSRAGRFLRDQFSCNGKVNVICPDRISPLALRILEFFPLANRPGQTQNFAQTASRKNDSWSLFLRIDQNVGTKQHLFFTYGRKDNPRSTPGVTLAFPPEGVNGEFGTIESHPRTAVLSDTFTFRPNLIAEVRGSFTRNVIQTHPRSAGFDFTQLGINQAVKQRAEALLFPRIDISDVSSLGPDRASFFNDAEQAEEFQSHTTYVRGAHTMKGGFQFSFMAFNVFRPERPAGQYVFARGFTQGPDPSTTSASAGFGVATFLLGAPTGGQITLDPTLAASQKYYAWYLNDEWKALRNVTLQMGVRWEYQTPWSDRFNQLAFFDPQAVEPLTGQKGVLEFVGSDSNSHYQSDPDKNNFAPRLGIAWEVLKNTVLRAAYGLFYFPGSGGIGAGASDLGSGFLASTPVFLGQTPAAPNTPPAGASLANPFQAGFVSPPSTGVGGGLTTAFRKWITPFNQQWNLNIQRALTRDMIVEVAYVGSRGEHIWINRNRNAVDTKYLSMGTDLDTLVTNPFFGKISGIGAQSTVRKSQLLRPFPHYTDITRFRDPIGDSIYHAFTVRVDKRFSHGLLVQGSYTISKSIDDVTERFSGRSALIDPNNLSLSRSVSDEDRPQVLKINFVYQLPFGQGRKWLGHGPFAAVFGNWQFSGIGNFQAGRPVIITASGNTHLPGVTAYAMRVKSPILPDGQQTLDRWFDKDAFLPPPQFSLGNDSRTQPNLRGPGIRRVDLSLSRTQRIKERVNLQFRGEFFNAFNTPQFGEPIGSMADQNFGRIISSVGIARQVQLGLRLAF
ncbi:MAG TPA: carboxypeptidase regulatory-like domain-containing protein [Blastocatellia bacterium]